MRHYLNYLLSAIVLLCGGGLLRAQEAQVCDVKNPIVGDRNMETVEISRVECTPETTTLYMEAYNRKGYWIQVGFRPAFARCCDGARLSLAALRGGGVGAARVYARFR
ncbi:hypothetical protein [Paraprevotella xylaniphila]|uniref:hypothetical protein n=1 Tax=Paraprevotella xylaniphila TaxID=454155 RepID=UPI001E3AF81E|nr:hypothetical protein [Paraprevotella xylaniphila]